MLSKLYPFGKAPFVILVVAILSGLAYLATQLAHGKAEKPDLTFVIFAKNHMQAYQEAIDEFNRTRGVNVQLQLVDQKALSSRLQSALMTGTEVPDVVELLEGTMGYFTRGPLESVGFVDLTDRLEKEGILHRLVESRYSLWSSRGRIFALPHDVHPVALCYRRDLVEKLGIDVSKLETWDDFVKMGLKIRADLDGDGIPDRYALDLTRDDVSGLLMLATQRGVDMFDAEGRLTMDNEIWLDTILWYVRQTEGENRIAYSAGSGQNLSKAFEDGLDLFFLCPDWRAVQFEMDMPYLSGKLALMPLPAWEKGGCRTSTWGGTGLAISKQCRNQELAWDFAKFLYLDKNQLGRRFQLTKLIPPLKEAWNMPEFAEKSEFYSGMEVGRFYASLAEETPPRYASPYSELAGGRILKTYLSALAYYKKNGEDGLREYTRKELAENAAYVQRNMDRNVFLNPKRSEKGEAAQ